MLGAGSVTGVDLDPDALVTARQNLEDFDIDNVDLVNLDVRQADRLLRPDSFEVVIMNPPFGTKHNKGKLIFCNIEVKMVYELNYPGFSAIS